MDLQKMPGVHYCEFKKNDIIIRQGEKLDAVYYLISGVCYRRAVNKKGDEIIYGIKESQPGTEFSPNFVQSVIGVLVLYSEDGISSSNFCASVKCCCYRIPKEVFFSYVQDKPDAITQIAKLAMKELRILAGSFQARQEGQVANQLCRLLLKHAKPGPDGVLTVKNLSNLAIGQLLGIHKVTVSRILRALKLEEVIDKYRNCIVIRDGNRLKEYAWSEQHIDY
jgi:CRP-like cAMP-binding protein